MKKINFKLKKIIVLFLCAALALSGCSASDEGDATGFALYYITKDQNGIVAVPYEPVTEKTEDQISEMLGMLSVVPEDVELRRVLTGEIYVESFDLYGNQLSLTLTPEYLELDSITEVLTRAAVVETLTSIPRVQRVTFFVGKDPLTDANGNLIGSMTGDTFVQNPGEQINSFQEAVVQLYFSNLDGDALVQETQQVHYSSNISMEKLVIERLLAGPLSENLKSAIPAGTQLLSVTAVDGVCYVNFDDAFKNQDYEVQEAVVIYSIVDSLLTLDGISKVQISINGDTSGVYRDRFSLSTQYEANYDLIEEE